MRQLRERRVEMLNAYLRRQAARNGRKLLGRLLAEQARLEAGVMQKLAEIEAQVLAGDQCVRDDMGAAILSVVEAHNESCEAITEEMNNHERTIRVIAEQVIRTPMPAPRGRIPDDLNRRPRFHGN